MIVKGQMFTYMVITLQQSKLNSIIIKDGGWQSNTTKSRLNALLDEFSYGMRVFQKNWEWFVSYKNVSEDFISGMELAID